MKHLYKNLSGHGGSPDRAIRSEYERIRLRAAAMYRDIERMVREPGDPAAPGRLQQLDAGIRDFDQALNARIDELIRNRAISPRVATSLMNDGAYIRQYSKCLVRVAELVLELHRPGPESVELALELEENSR